MRQHIGKIAEQLVHQKQHIVEIERILQLEKLLIVLVNRRARLFEAVVGKAFRIGGEQQSVLPLADHRLHLGERESFAGVAPGRPGRLLQQPLLVGVVGDREAGQVTELLRFAAQNPDAEAVERAERDPGRDLRVDELRKAFAHLARRLVRESHAENLLRGNSDRKHMGDPERDDPGLAGSGSGQHENRPVHGAGGIGLFGVQLRKEVAHSVIS